MKKSEVELVIISAIVNGECAIKMKIYKNGTTCRFGVGGLPEIGLSLMSFVNDTRYFDPLMESITQEMLNTPLDYQEPTPNGYLEFAIVFFGESRNGDTGERADWAKVTGTRFRTDLQTNFNHPIRTKIDTIITDTAERTNELYFDAFIQVVYKAKSSTFPEQSIISAPKTGAKLNEDFGNYINQMRSSERKWDMSEYVKNKTYYINHVGHRVMPVDVGGRFEVKFMPEFGEDIELGTFEGGIMVNWNLVSKEYTNKYGLTESYRERNQLTMDSTNHSFHFTIYANGEEAISISDRGKSLENAKPFLSFLMDDYSDKNGLAKGPEPIAEILAANIGCSLNPQHITYEAKLKFFEAKHPLFFV